MSLGKLIDAPGRLVRRLHVEEVRPPHELDDAPRAFGHVVERHKFPIVRRDEFVFRRFAHLFCSRCFVIAVVEPLAVTVRGLHARFDPG